ncbi:MAG: prolipoprotein diacylglyceryl transferase [Candidatus Woesearchaeota archaeon]
MIDPIAFTIAGISVRWYGIILAAGFLFSFWFSGKLAPQRNIKKEDIYDLFVYLIPAILIGARIFHIVSQWSYYSADPIKMLYIWQGGIAFHGGFIGAFLAIYIFCRARKIKTYDVLDILVIPLALGLSVGRIGNFINQEFYGKPTNLPWGIYFDNVEGKRHPSQIYETIKNFVIFLILYNLYKVRKIKSGNIFWSFVFLYSLFRFFVEFYKDLPDLFFGLTWGQLWSVPLFILSVVFLYFINRKKVKHE